MASPEEMAPEMKILVVGEQFNDKYYIGSSTRISPEAPVPVVRVERVLELPGGSANVEANLAVLGAGVRTIHQAGDMPTKNRLICDGQQLARWDENDTCEAPFIHPTWRSLSIECNAVIISDYGKGLFTHELMSWLDAYAHNAGQVFVDTKAHPDKFGFLNPIYFPNQAEYNQYKNAYNKVDRAVYKQGSNGISWMERGQQLIHLPARSAPDQVVSVSGAGDTVIASFAYAYLKSKGNVAFSLDFANKAAAVVVRKPFTSTATMEEIEAL